MFFFNTTLDGLQFGLCYAILAIGLYISYSILDFPDLSVDGIFPFGGIIGTIAMYSWGLHPIFAIILSCIAGMAAGAVTGLLHVKCHISKLLCGIIVMTGFASITLALTMVLTGTGYTQVLFPYGANGVQGLFNGPITQGMTNTQRKLYNIAVLAVIVLVVKIMIDLFLKTKMGFMLRATGNNEQMVVSLGKDPGNYKILGLSLADGLVGISGCLYAQMMQTYDNTCGAGKVVIALVAVILGVTLFGNIRFMKGTTACIIGAIIYSLALYYFTILDSNGIYLKLFNAVFFVIVLIVSEKYKQFHSKGLRALATPGGGMRKSGKNRTEDPEGQ